jgi:hypothetical protein
VAEHPDPEGGTPGKAAPSPRVVPPIIYGHPREDLSDEQWMRRMQSDGETTDGGW